MYINKILFYLRWGFRCKILNKKIPLNSSIIINDKCNLNCRHCVVSNLGYKDLDFERVKNDILILYNFGSRMLIITGGEPFLWKNNKYSLEDVVRYAKKIGFFRVVICTNGTLGLNSSADYLWVSLDGFVEEHNYIRGDIYEKVIKNIVLSNHKNIFINFTISKINHEKFEVAAKNILRIKNVRGIFFHLFTPYIGSDMNLKLDRKERKIVLDKLHSFKKKYFLKVINTFAGIKALKENNWERNSWSSVTMSQGKLSFCCCRNGIYNKETCDNCGCSPAVESWVLQRIKLGAVIENFRFL